MRKKGVLVLLIALLLAGGGFASIDPGLPDIPAGTYTYLDETGEKRSRFSWEISYHDELVEIAVQGEDYAMLNRCRSDGDTVYWRVGAAGGTAVEARRDGDRVRFSGPAAETMEDVTLDLKQHPWYQPLSFSLREFLASGDDAVVFWTVRQDTLDPVQLKARKVGTDQVAAAGRNYPAVIVEIRVNGLLSPFWRGRYWYSADNGLFLQYRGASGPPGAPEKVIRLAALPGD